MLIPLCHGELSLIISSWYVPHSSYILWSFIYTFTTKLFQCAFFMFLIIPFIFFAYPCVGLHSTPKAFKLCLLHYSSVTSQWISIQLVLYSLPYVWTVMFRLILSLKVTPEHTLHGRVKDSINHHFFITFLGRTVILM